MKFKRSNECADNAGVATGFSNLCLRSCKRILAQIRKIKVAIFSEWRGRVATHERMLQLALNEAEALAWQTAYPHLLFPVLATEKVQALADWNRHQQMVRRSVRPFVFAA